MPKETSVTITSNDKVVQLDEAIKRGDSVIQTVSLRKPTAGDLRGINLMELMQLNVNALQEVLPRVTTPSLAKHEISGMDPADLLEMGASVASFLAKKADRSGFPA